MNVHYPIMICVFRHSLHPNLIFVIMHALQLHKIPMSCMLVSQTWLFHHACSLDKHDVLTIHMYHARSSYKQDTKYYAHSIQPQYSSLYLSIMHVVQPNMILSIVYALHPNTILVLTTMYHALSSNKHDT